MVSAILKYMVPVYVYIDDGHVTKVIVDDEAPLKNPEMIEGDPAELVAAIDVVEEDQCWPSWEFGW